MVPGVDDTNLECCFPF